MTTTKVAMSFRLDPRLVEILQTIKARDGVPAVQTVERACWRWFEERGEITKKKTATKATKGAR